VKNCRFEEEVFGIDVNLQKTNPTTASKKLFVAFTISLII